MPEVSLTEFIFREDHRMKPDNHEWTLDHVEDLRRNYGEKYRPGTCEQCGKTGLRYVHVISGDDPLEKMRVGACCAMRLVTGYDAVQQQRQLGNQYARVCRIPTRKGWHKSGNNNQTIVIERWRLTVFRDKENSSRFRFLVSRGDTKRFAKRNYKTEMDAMIAAAREFADLAGWFDDESILDEDQG